MEFLASSFLIVAFVFNGLMMMMHGLFPGSLKTLNMEF